MDPCLSRNMGTRSQLALRHKHFRQSVMAKPPSGSLRKDFRIFRDPGFLFTLVLIGLLASIGAYILVQASNEYGIPIREYWH
jgi:hypothetical protein